MNDITVSEIRDILVNKTSEESSFRTIFEHIKTNSHSNLNRDTIWDMQLFNFNDSSAIELQSFISQTSEFSFGRNDKKVALVSRSDLGFGMLRVLETLSDEEYGFTTMVFREIDDAIEWIEN